MIIKNLFLRRRTPLLALIVAMIPLPTSVGVADFYSLELILHISDLVLDLVSHEPLIVAPDHFLHFVVFPLALLLSDRKVVGELVTELAFALLSQLALHCLERMALKLRLEQCIHGILVEKSFSEL